MRAWVVAACLTTVLSGCTGDSSLFGDPEPTCYDTSGVVNQPDTFSYGGAAACKNGQEAFDWDNQAAQARVVWSGTVQSGHLVISIEDAAGRAVYHATIDGQTTSGAVTDSEQGLPSLPGGLASWQVHLDFDDYAGTLGLVLQPTQ